MTVRLLLIRHAETDANANGRAQGHRDVPLNERGRVQAAEIAGVLASEPIVAVYSSDLQRASATAEAIAEAHAVEVQLDARLREVDQGELDGLTGEQMRERHPDFLRQWRGDLAGDLRIPGGETLGEAQHRMVAAIEEIAREHEEDLAAQPAAGAVSTPFARQLGGVEVRPTIVVVSHNLALRVLLCHALRVPVGSFRCFRHDVACLAEVEVRRDEPWTVVRLNERCHLDHAVDASGAAEREVRPAGR